MLDTAFGKLWSTAAPGLAVLLADADRNDDWEGELGQRRGDEEFTAAVSLYPRHANGEPAFIFSPLID